ncbi:MAG: SCP2 sterol-binding domain-containing protein [Anaerolineaceae bacterium]|nr:SCP2 sterol-binding domain-containing protein [Anaerolineaceae bacterium]NTV36765.1 SCP2 sterol-binding domain-containing protein [Anaerolineaceae bacterium]
MTDLNLDEMMNKIPAAFLPEKAAGVNASILLHVTGEPGGDYMLVIKDQTCKVVKGATTNPNLTLSASVNDLIAIFKGELDGMKAFMTGKLKLQGDMGLAMRFTGLFKS